jgi:peptidoglycan hydrolase-like protein with peptidoglycan-binding domain
MLVVFLNDVSNLSKKSGEGTMSQTTSQLREAWKEFECNPDRMRVINFGPDRIRVAPQAADAFQSLSLVLLAHGYQIRVDDTDSYNCRAIKGGTAKSLHSYGIAVDVNWDTNSFKVTPDGREIRFSNKPTQAERGADVKLGIADTDMTPEMIQDVLAIKTRNGQRVFEWGGNWKDRKDAMHFELDVTPAELEAGIDRSSIKTPAGAPAVAVAEERPVSAPAEVAQALTTGARGERVRQLQIDLQGRGFPPGDIDGIYGPLTRAAVAAFQTAHGAAATGTADEATLQALARAPARINGGEAATMNPDDILRVLLSTLIRSQVSGAATPTTPAAGAVNTQQLLRTVLTALMGQQPVAPSPTSPSGTAPPVLSPIDRVLGGEALAGKKTPLAILAYAVLAILQSVDVAGTATGATATPTGQILTTLIGAFGGLGVLGKVDRVVQMLGLIAARPPAAPPR